MILDSELRGLSSPNINESILEAPLKKLRAIAKQDVAPNESQHFMDRKKNLISRLKQRSVGENFEQATNVHGRERLLLSIYLEYLNKSQENNWLPDFDGFVAKSILGLSGKKWHKGRRRQATLLFFTHFNRIGALPFLCDRLHEAYGADDANDLDDAKKWHRHRTTIFDRNGPAKIAKQSDENSPLQKLMEQFAIPATGRFAETLRRAVFLKTLESVPFGEVVPVFEEIEKQRDEWVSSELRLGAAALHVMVRRVANEGHGNWPEDKEWVKWITRFGCDPRHGRSSVIGAKWWGWATDSELRLAQKGITYLNLGFFIDFLKKSLDGGGKEEQFKHRSKFLRTLFEKGKIRDARLVLNNNTFYKLDSKYRNPLSVAKLVGTTDQTSIICLDCVDDVQIIEGTHSFGLRVFRPQFPVEGFWKNPHNTYPDNQLRISQNNCPIFLTHSPSGIWVKKFTEKLREQFHLEWNDIEI